MRIVDNGISVVIDRTNLTVKSRKKLLDIINKSAYSYKKIAIVLECDPDVLEQRLNSRPGKSIPSHAINNMRKTFQKPTKEEGFDDIVEVRTDEDISFDGDRRD